MEDFASYLHLLIGFFLLGAAINVGLDITQVLKAALDLFGFSVTISDISGIVPFVLLQACATFGTIELPVLDVLEEISTVAVYEGLPRRRATSESTTVSNRLVRDAKNRCSLLRAGSHQLPCCHGSCEHHRGRRASHAG